jgi:phosphoribosylformylglycinamidine cyclo-ligase
MSRALTYAKAGVDVKSIRKVQAKIRKAAEETFKFRPGNFGKVISKFGHYASLINIGGGRALALHADGVGTKVLIAQLMNRYDTVGIDVVAMCTNDLICMGAEPLALIDYLAVQRPDEDLIDEIMRGLVKGAEMANVAVVGGETAVMPDVIEGAVEGKGFDLAALSVGVVEKKKIITGEAMRPGDVIVGLESSGIHSNGLTLARKVLFERGKLKVSRILPTLRRSVGEELLEPTKIYVKPVLEILENVEVHALANVTGGAFSKLRRFEEYVKVGFRLDKMPKPQPIFEVIQKLGSISDEEMHQTFNMGVGFCVVAPKRQAGKVVKICKKYKVKATVIGEVTPQINVIKIKNWKGNWISL